MAQRRLTLDKEPGLQHLLAEWDYELNDPLRPEHVTAGLRKKVSWRCSNCGHRWQTRISHRAAGRGCCKCDAVAKAVPTPGQSFGDLRPEVATQWAHDLNGVLTPFDVTAASAQKVWFRCERGHERLAAVYAMRGRNCRKCDHIERSKPGPGASLAELRPDLAAEWDYLANGDLTPWDVAPGTSRILVAWICAGGHRWRQKPNTRTSGTGHGCPQCPRIVRMTPKPGASFGDLHPTLVDQWDDGVNGDLTPFHVKPFCDMTVGWRCPFGHSWKSKICHRALGTGCPVCTKHGWSYWEVRIRSELVACGLPVAFPHPRIKVSGRRSVPADIVIPDLGLIIECDGLFAHSCRGFESTERDRKQSEALERAGWLVIRLRQGLDPVGQLDVVVPKHADVHAGTLALLQRLTEIGVKVPVERYLESGPWAISEAERLIDQYLREGVPSAQDEHASQLPAVQSEHI